MQNNSSDCQGVLKELNLKIRNAIKSGTHNTQYPQEILFVLLADFFSYHVQQGGFAQLIYNAKGAYLQEMEEMLLAAEAAVTHNYYVQAIGKCLDDKDQYHHFLATPYTDDSELKNGLHAVSIDYFKNGGNFFGESEAWVYGSIGAVEGWLNDGNM